MYRNAETFLRIVYESLYAPYGTGSRFLDIDWKLLYQYAVKSKLCTVTYPTVKRISDDTNEIPKDVLKQWEEEYIVGKSRAETSLEQLRMLNSMAQERNITFCVFKGCVLGDLYPKGTYRVSNDTDVLVDAENGEKLEKLLKECGYQYCPQDSSEQVAAYELYKDGIRIDRMEVHYSVWEEFTGPKIEKLKEYGVGTLENTQEQIVCGMKVRTFQPTKHLIYQMFHIIKHVICEGMNFSPFGDITLFVNESKDDIKWDEFWEEMDALGYATFCETFFAMCHIYLKMDDSMMEHRTNPSLEQRWNLLWQFILKTTRELPQAQDALLHMLCRPYVDGMDAYEDPEKELPKKEYSEVYKYGKSKIETMHLLGLTRMETSLGNVEQKEIVFTKDIQKAKEEAKYFYSIYGITVASEIEMFELLPGERLGKTRKEADVYVHYCPVGMLDNPQLQMIKPNRVWFQGNGNSYLVQNANEIVVDKREENKTDKDVKSYVISHGLAFILHMLDAVALHGATIGKNDKALTIIGTSGSGKSTISTSLMKQGYQLVADDISVMKVTKDDIQVQIAVPQQKYCKDTALKEGYNIEDLECINEARDKYRLILKEEELYQGNRSLAGIFEIMPDKNATKVFVEQPKGLELLKLLSYNMFSQYLFSNTNGMSPKVFQAALEIAKRVPVYTIHRPQGMDTVEEITNTIISLVEN